MNEKKFRIFIRVFLVLALMLGMAATLQATAPVEQRTNPDGVNFDNLYSVVDMVSSPTVDIGTGSIIHKMDIEGIGYFCVLTADHNFPNSTAIGFGDWGTAPNPANAFATTYPIIHVESGGSTGTKDIAVATVRYGPTDLFWASIKELSLWAAPSGTDNQLATYTNANINDFTEVGYGNTGTPRFVGGVQVGFDTVNSSGIQRFQNNERKGVNVNAAHGGYTYTDFTWTPDPVSPGNPDLGNGSSFGGDSGGPYFLDDVVTKTVTGLIDVFDTAVPPQDIDLYTDTIFAVHTFGNNNNPQLFSDNIDHGGVLLSAADIAWIATACVPEPSSVVMLIMCTLGLIVGAWRRK
ncbi:MAG TPA: PEP-CTERM sorting domain-containing protein [Thermoguttaceae bacterium]